MSWKSLESITAVKKERLARLHGHRQLPLERGALRFGRGEVAVVVEAALAHRHDLRALPELGQFAERARVQRLRIMGVDARGREDDAAVRLGEIDGEPAGSQRSARGQNLRHTRGLGARQQAVGDRRQLRRVEVDADVDHPWRFVV
jgi:hypothetical protein